MDPSVLRQSPHPGAHFGAFWRLTPFLPRPHIPAKVPTPLRTRVDRTSTQSKLELQRIRRPPQGDPLWELRNAVPETTEGDLPEHRQTRVRTAPNRLSA